MDDQAATEKLWNRNFLIILLANSFVSMNFFMLNPTFPVYVNQITGNLGTAGLLTGLFTLSAMLIRPIAGMTIDKYDRKRIFMAGMLLMCISFIGYIAMYSLPGIIITRLVHGIGWGLATTAIATMASDNIPHSRIGEGIGYFNASAIISMAAGPVLGLEIIHASTINYLFYAAGGFTLLGGLFMTAFNKRTANIQKRDAIKRFDISSLFEKSAVLPAGAVFFLMIVASAASTFLAMYAAEKGILNIGFFFVVQSAAILISRPLAGRMVDKKGFGIVIIPGLIFTVLSMFMLFIANEPLMFIISAFVYGLGFGVTSSSLQAMSVVNVKTERRGAANGTYFTGVDMGFGLGTIITGFVAKAVGYGMMYLLCIIPLLFALALFVFNAVTARMNEE